MEQSAGEAGTPGGADAAETQALVNMMCAAPDPERGRDAKGYEGTRKGKRREDETRRDDRKVRRQ